VETQFTLPVAKATALILVVLQDRFASLIAMRERNPVIQRSTIMNLVKKIITRAAFAAVLSLTTTVAVQAADVLTMKPLQAVSFDIEAKHAVGYFSNDDGTCKLVVTLADAPNADDVTAFVTTRFEAAIDAGKTTRFAVTPGKSLDFACQPGAQAMAVIGLEQIAASPHGR
jgi:hypothetical protein